MSEEPIPVAVVGAGNMGANHVRVYDELPGADLVEVVEPDPEIAAEVRENYDARVLDSVEDLSVARAATVAVPNAHHRRIAEECAERGIDVLVEKPLAVDLDDARAIVETAAEHDVVLQVGHIERYNPAVQTLSDIVDTEELIAIEAHRLGPFNEHLVDENVLFDLMIHDIDVIVSLVDAPLEICTAMGTTPRSDAPDHAVGQFKFENGVLGTATASHVTHGKIRTMAVTTRDAYITLDYQQQSISVQRRGIERTTELLDKSGYRTETVTESPFVRTREPLKVELEHFLSCVRSRETPKTDGEGGIRAVEIAHELQDAFRSSATHP